MAGSRDVTLMLRLPVACISNAAPSGRIAGKEAIIEGIDPTSRDSLFHMKARPQAPALGGGL
jgi:hypothetical protein